MQRRNSIYLGSVFVLLAVSAAQAGNIGFQINPTQSHLSLSGVFRHSSGGIYPITGSSGLNATYSGMILTDSDLSTLVFMGGTIDANAIGVAPPGPTPYDYSISASLPAPEGSIIGAIREFSFAMTGQADPLSSGYDLATAGAVVTSGSMDTSVLPTKSLAGASAILIAGTGTLFETTTTKTLNLPLTIAFEEQIPGSDYSMEFTLSGMVVATRVIPEPVTGLMLGVGALLIATRRRH